METTTNPPHQLPNQIKQNKLKKPTQPPHDLPSPPPPFYLFFFEDLVGGLTDSFSFFAACMHLSPLLRYTFCDDRIYKCNLRYAKTVFQKPIQFNAVQCNQKFPSILLELSSKCNLIQFTFLLVFKFLTGEVDVSQTEQFGWSQVLFFLSFFCCVHFLLTPWCDVTVSVNHPVMVSAGFRDAALSETIT